MTKKDGGVAAPQKHILLCDSNLGEDVNKPIGAALTPEKRIELEEDAIRRYRGMQ